MLAILFSFKSVFNKAVKVIFAGLAFQYRIDYAVKLFRCFFLRFLNQMIKRRGTASRLPLIPVKARADAVRDTLKRSGPFIEKTPVIIRRRFRFNPNRPAAITVRAGGNLYALGFVFFPLALCNSAGVAFTAPAVRGKMGIPKMIILWRSQFCYALQCI
jgi:hypothetical protein